MVPNLKSGADFNDGYNLQHKTVSEEIIFFLLKINERWKSRVNNENFQVPKIRSQFGQCKYLCIFVIFMEFGALQCKWVDYDITSDGENIM